MMSIEDYEDNQEELADSFAAMFRPLMEATALEVPPDYEGEEFLAEVLVTLEQVLVTPTEVLTDTGAVAAVLAAEAAAGIEWGPPGVGPPKVPPRCYDCGRPIYGREQGCPTDWTFCQEAPR